jgi:hypothetical protein
MNMQFASASEAACPPVLAAVRATGSVLLPSVFDADLMNRLATAMDASRIREEALAGTDVLSSMGQSGYISDVLDMGEPILELLGHPKLETLLADLFQEEPRLWVAQGISLDPGKGRGMWPRCWHDDMFQIAQQVGDPGFIFGVNCLVFIDDVDSANGGTLTLPGSQRLPDLLRSEEKYLVNEVEQASAPKGSILLIESGTWHAAGINDTQMPRRVLKLLFTRRWIRPQLDYLAFSSPDTIAKMPPKVRRYFDVNL